MGGAFVIWSTTDYEKEALSQLNDNKYYEYVPANSTTVISTQTTKIGTQCVHVASQNRTLWQNVQ